MGGKRKDHSETLTRDRLDTLSIAKGGGQREKFATSG